MSHPSPSPDEIRRDAAAIIAQNAALVAQLLRQHHPDHDVCRAAIGGRAAASCSVRALAELAAVLAAEHNPDVCPLAG